MSFRPVQAIYVVLIYTNLLSITGSFNIVNRIKSIKSISPSKFPIHKMASKMASTTQSTDIPHDENQPSIPHTWTVYVDLTLPPNRRETVAIMTRKYPTSLDVKVFKSATYLSPSSVVMAFKLFGIERVRVFGCVIDKKKSKKESRVRCLREDGVGFEACDVTTLSRVKETIQELGVEGGEYDEEYEDDVARTLAAWQHYQSDPGEQAIKLLEDLVDVVHLDT